MREIAWQDFEKVELRAGTVVLAVPDKAVRNGAKLG